RIRALPEGVQEQRVEARQGRVEVRRVGHQRAALQDQLQIVARALRVLESGRAERREARQARPPPGLELAVAEELAERTMHRRRDRAVARLELARGARRRAGHAHAPGEPSELARVLRQRVRLQLVENLQPVLDGSQVLVVAREQAAEIGRQVAALGEAEDRLQAVRLAQPRVVASVQKLERLDDELDLADAAASELDVGRLAALGTDGAVDLRLHRPDGRDDARVESRTVDGLARQGAEARADGRVAGRDTRLDERLPLPQLGALTVVGAVAVERENDRAHPALGPQAQIDAEHVPLVGDLLEQRDQLAADAREVLAVGHAAGAAAARLAVL